MRIRSMLVTAFLVATLVPSAIFGVWSYNQGVDREFSEVEDHHLLIAENLGIALKRYHTDVVTAFETIAESILAGNSQTDFTEMMENMNLFCVLVFDKSSGKVAHGLFERGRNAHHKFSATELQMLEELATNEKSRFSPVMSSNGQNVMFLVRKYGQKIAVAYVKTDYFIELGNSVAFGERGHAAIVDKEGNILAHPLPDWVEQRKNIAKVSAVKRMMNGETGIERFYSPALKGDMIAGLTTVEGPGWGIMVPQPISEIHAKVNENNSSMLVVIGVGLFITLVSVFIMANSMARPLEQIARVLRKNTSENGLEEVESDDGLLSVQEVREFRASYNEMVARERNANEKIKKLAYTDSVTGLPNREKFKLKMAEEIKSCNDSEGCGAVIFIDLDNFKEINDIHGHEVGDDFLRSCAEKLKLASQKLESNPDIGNPTVARIGGDEFTILVPGIVDIDDIHSFLDQLREELSNTSDDMSFISTCSASIGCAQYPADGRSVEELLHNADVAMYEAKKMGKNTAQIYDRSSGSKTAAEIRRDLNIAVDENQLYLEYQPKICTKTSAVRGIEALVRWKHPELGLLMPSDWLPAINSSPSIATLGTWVVNRAMQDQAMLEQAGYPLVVSINIGSRHFISSGFVEGLEGAAIRNSFDNSKLEIEITEDAIFDAPERAEDVLNSLHNLGCSISIDDFGIGYSNIVRLAQLPVDVIKIDRSIVLNACSDQRIKTIMESTVTMAHDLNCQIVAEGIENLQQAEFASRLGADLLQGHFFASSMRPNDLINWMSEQKSNAVHSYQNSLEKMTG